MSSNFRPAHPSDLDTLLDLVRDFHVEEHLAYDRPTVARIITDLIAQPALGQLWVLDTDVRVAGYALVGYGYSIEYGGRDAFIDEIFIIPDFRKKGLGTAFLKWIEQQARLIGISVIHLEVDHDNSRAFEVYKAFGFKPKNRKMMSLWLG